MKGLQESDYFFPTNVCGFHELWADSGKFISENMKIYSFAKIYPVKIFSTIDKIRENLSYENIVIYLFFNVFIPFCFFFFR